MAVQLVDFDAERDWEELAAQMLDAYLEPKSTLYDLFFPVLGDGPQARAAALPEHAARLRAWHESDPESYWHKVVDGDSGEMIAAALWRIHRTNPFTTHEDHTATYYPEGSRRDFVTQAIDLFGRPRARMARRPHLYLNILWTHPRHRHRGAADLIMKWGLAKAQELDLEIWLDAFPPARHFYPKYGFGEIETLHIRPHTATPDAEWTAMERAMLPLTIYIMWRPRGGPYVAGQSVRPWEEGQ